MCLSFVNVMNLGFVELYLCVTLFLTPLLDLCLIFLTLCHVLSPSMVGVGCIFSHTLGVVCRPSSVVNRTWCVVCVHHNHQK